MGVSYECRKSCFGRDPTTIDVRDRAIAQRGRTSRALSDSIADIGCCCRAKPSRPRSGTKRPGLIILRAGHSAAASVLIGWPTRLCACKSLERDATGRDRHPRCLYYSARNKAQFSALDSSDPGFGRIKTSESSFPARSSAISQRGCLPRPLQVSLFDSLDCDTLERRSDKAACLSSTCC